MGIKWWRTCPPAVSWVQRWTFEGSKEGSDLMWFISSKNSFIYFRWNCLLFVAWLSLNVHCFSNLMSPALRMGFLGGASDKEPACQSRRHRRLGSIPGWGRSPGGGHGNPLQCSCLENPLDRGACWATVHGIAQSRTWLSDLAYTHSKNTFLTSHPGFVPSHVSFFF